MSFYAEAGHRFDVGAGSTITPFRVLNFARGELQGTTESDPFGTGASLRIHKSRADSFATVLGGRFEGVLGGFTGGTFNPFLSVAWEHEFDPTRQKVKMSFAEGPSGADFKVISANTPRDSVLLGVGGNWIVDNSFDLGLGYDGRFNSKYTSHSVTGRVGYKF